MKPANYVFLLVAMLFSTHTIAETGEQSKKFGDYTVYYNAFNSSILSPKVARQYGISRSGNNGVVNIAVHKGKGETKAAIDAYISGNVKNLLSQKTKLLFKKIDEGDSIYYIATFTFSNQDNLTFEINMTPTDEKRQYNFKFSNHFFIE